MYIIDATNLILGRLASYAAKLALSGEQVAVINCEKAVISGDRKMVFARYLRRRARGDAMSGPYFPRQSDRIVRRTIEGMLPHKLARGREAFKRVMCYMGTPQQFADKPIGTVSGAGINKLGTPKYVTLRKLAERLGAK